LQLNNNNNNNNRTFVGSSHYDSVSKNIPALRVTLNWKAPGRDQIPNFWLKKFTATHKHIATISNKLLEADQIPECLTAGITFLIPKNKNTGHPKNYRPVTVCLQHTNYLHLL
jgi:hypothetical protein